MRASLPLEVADRLGLLGTAHREVCIRECQSAARELLHEPDFLQNLDSLVDLVLRNRGTDVLGYLLHVHHAAVQVEVGAHGGDPPVLEQLEFRRL